MPQPAKKQKFRCTYRFERRLQAQGYRCIAGVDEVGRGALCGPVVAAAVLFPARPALRGVRDSKQLSPAQRERLMPRILKEALSFGVGIVSAEEIDRINIYQATLKAMRIALQQLHPGPDFILLDGTPVKGWTVPCLSIVKGDARCLTIAAASIVAKVFRDRLMLSYANLYPRYDWVRNKGYSCRSHFEALHAYGSTALHRKSFRPIYQETHQLEFPGTG